LSVTGASIPPEATLVLRNGAESITATGVTVPNLTTINGTVSFIGATAGNWDVLIRAGQTDKALIGVFKLEQIDLNSVTPSTAAIAETALNVTIAGANFTSDLSVSLTRSGFTTITATTWTIVSSFSITAEFNLTGAQRGGRWDPTLSKPGGASVSLTDGFGIITPAFKVLNVDQTQTNIFTVTATPGVQQVNWPAGTMDQDIVLDIDGDPVLAAVNPAVDPQYGARPSGGTGIELVANPTTASFLNPFTITLIYDPATLLPPANEAALIMGVYNSVTGRWEPIPSTVDTVANTVSASVNHLSVFSILQLKPANALNNAVVFPNPFRDNIHSFKRITFNQLTSGSRVRIFEISGELVQDLKDNIGSGTVIWNLDNESGQKVASGIYYYLITDPSGNKKTGRVGVIK